MFRGVEDALLALEHTVIAVLHQQAQHGGAQHPGHYLHLPLFGRQLLAGVESIFQQIAQHHAEVGLRDGQLAGQFQPPVHRHAEAVGLVVVVTGQSIHGRIRAEGGALLAQLGFVLVQVVFQLIHLPGLGESGDDVEMLTEVVAEMPRLLHIGPQLGVAAGFHGQKLVFPVELGAAGVFPGHLIHLVQQQKDAQQRDGDGQNRNDHQTVDEHDGRVQRHTEDEESRVDGGQRPGRLPEGFAPVLLQQPAAPLDGGEPEDDAEHCRESQLEQGGGDETGRGVVAYLSPGVEHRGKQGADRRHDAGDGEEKGGLAHGNFRTHPPAQQPERRQQGGQKQDVAVQLEDGAEGRRCKADDRDESGCQHSGAPGCLHMLPQGREAEECPRVEDGEVQKIASK